MVTSARIRDELRPAGLDWITSLRAPQIQAMAEEGGPLHRALKESWKAQDTKPSLRRYLRSSRRPRASGCAWQVAATAATISGRWSSGLKSTTARFASWDQSPTCCER
jgi:hypothetical protein